MDNSKHPYICDICQAAFAGEDNLQVHFWVHASENPYVCEIYNTEKENVLHIESLNDLEEHVKRPAGENLCTCKTCNNMITPKDDLNAHLMVHVSENLYNNEIDSTTFADEETLNGDLEPNESHTCHVCQKSFARKIYLFKHFKVHTDIKPYVCHVCQKAFAWKTNLDRHFRLHTGEKPYACGTCGKVFTQKWTLNKHFRLHTGEKPYFCGTCGKAFTHKWTLNVHNRLHTGEKPYVCDTCGMAFTHRKSLYHHFRRHTS